MNIGKRIKDLRREKGISQEQMAEKISLSRPQYSKIEGGKADITLSTLDRIATVFEVAITDLFFDTEGLDISSINKGVLERLKMLDGLDDETKKSIFNIIDIAVLNQRLKENLQATLNMAVR